MPIGMEKPDCLPISRCYSYLQTKTNIDKRHHAKDMSRLVTFYSEYQSTAQFGNMHLMNIILNGVKHRTSRSVSQPLAAQGRSEEST